MSRQITANLPAKLDFLLEKQARYKVAKGGRGSAKSWSYARALLLRGMQRKQRALCCRELQKSIKESVHHLLATQIMTLGLQDFYTVQATEIKGRRGTEFGFAGLRHNINEVKSYEDADIAWVEEGQTTSKASWDILIPTIRNEGSEIWVTYNPELEEDETHQRFSINPPADSIIIDMNWRDNPWFPDVLRREMEELKAKNYDDYLHIWEGKCKQVLEGAVYAQELRQADSENRITNVPYMAGSPVNVYFDLGYADYTSLWFEQRIGFEHRFIKTYQNRLQKVQHYLKYLQDTNYVFGQIVLPHDARSGQLGSDSIEAQFKAVYGDKVKVLPRIPELSQGINLARTLFSQCYFDRKGCADGIQALRRYKYKINDRGQFSREPDHDENSHYADAFRMFAEGHKVKVQPKSKLQTPTPINHPAGSGWMA